MSIVNRRNAVLGWATWKVHKRRVKKKARQAVPAVEERRPNKPAIAAAGRPRSRARCSGGRRAGAPPLRATAVEAKTPSSRAGSWS